MRRLNLADPLPALQALVVKDGVGLGGLPALQRSLALALVWAGLPAGSECSEREVNACLRAQLAGAAAFLDTDHVELRRWLVDTGWLQRDGYGRAYRRVAADALAPEQRALAEALADLRTDAWVAEARAAQRARRDAQRRDWLAARGAAT
jgi:hypothetical protein